MSFIQQRPCPRLAPFIECYWYASGEYGYRTEKILPSGALELIFNFAEPYQRLDPVDSSRIGWNRHAWICGLQSSYILARGTGRTDALGVRFKPGGFAHFDRVATGEFTDRIVELDLVIGTRAHDIRERLFETRGVARRFALLEQFLVDRLARHQRDQLIVQHAVNCIDRSGGRVRVGALSSALGISHKHLNARFRELVGLSPKLLARIVRFNRALARIEPRRHTSWAEIAHAQHYTDQAHFNKDFLVFTGETPSGYLAKITPHLGVDLVEGEDARFVPLD